MAIKTSEVEGAVVFAVKVVPGSSRTAIAGELDGMLKVKVSAPPEKGKANKELCAFLAKELGVKKNAVTVTAGMTNPIKTLNIEGVTSVEIAEKLKSGS